MISAMRAAPLRVLFMAVAVAVVGLMTVADLPSASPVHAQEQAVTATRDATGESPPARPTDLQASAGPDSVSLTWTASTDQTVTHYAVLLRDRDEDDAGVFEVIDSNAGSATSYTDRSVSPGGSYVYRVKAVSPTGVSQWSSYARADIPADPEDLAPSGLSAKAVFDGGDSAGVELAWDAPAADAESVTGYEILRAVGDGELATLAADTGSGGTTYADDTATKAGESYAYRVKALRGEETSQPSDRAEAIIPKVTAVDREPDIAEEQSGTTAWVSNTAQTLSTSFIRLGNMDKRHSQGFRTGAESGGYSLGSVGVYVRDEDLESGETFTVHIYTANASGAIDTLVHTLISPDSYADGAVNLFTAPADATLAANTDYLVVFEATGDAGDDFELGVTDSTSEDSGSATGWSIADTRRFDNSSFSRAFVISVNAAAAELAAVWSGTLTVAEVTADISYGCAIGFTGKECSSLLAPNDFTYNGTTYQITGLSTGTDFLNIGFLSDLGGDANSFVLNAVGETFSFQTADVSDLKSRLWLRDITPWAVGDMASVSITVSSADAVSTDATLSALSLSVGTLSPSFAADTLAYTGSVDNSVTSTTVTATANDDGATVAIVPADADDTADDHQVTLGVGDTAISVTVTAEDGTTMQTYAMTVTRAEAVEVKSIEMRRYDGDRNDEPYRIGDELIFVVEFSHGVACISSSPTRVRFDIGTSRKEATNYASTDSNKKDWHRYIVQEGDLDTDGITIPAGPEALPEKYTKDSCTGPAFDETGIAAQGPLADRKVDGVRPTPEFAATSLDGNSIIIIFSESLSATTAAASAFTLSVDTGTAPVVSSVNDPEGDTLTLGLTSALTSDQVVTVTYVDATSGDDAAAVQDAVGNDADTFTQTVYNNVAIVVSADWGLIPSGLGAGAEFRLIFISSGTRNAASTDIADYNTFVQTAAESGHADIQPYSSTFRVVGSTADVDARYNTGTTYTADDKGVAIYWLGGNKVADDYEDFYDETWDDEANAKDESGSVRSTSNVTDLPWTGSEHDGTEEFDNTGTSRALGGALWVVYARLNSNATGFGPLSSSAEAQKPAFHPLYGLSPVFRVSGQVVTNTAPAFTTGASFSTDENQAATFQVTAEDADAGDAVTYAITGGADLALFSINATSGLLAIPVSVDHENPEDADSNNVYLVTVTATGGTGARALTTDQAITVTVLDVDEPPSAPAAPTVSAVNGTSDRLSVSWTRPDDTGIPFNFSYDLQYRKGTIGDFTDGPQNVIGLTATIHGLDADSAYQVRVRATNDEGDSGWSSAGSGTTYAQTPPPDAYFLTGPALGTYAIDGTLSFTVDFSAAVTVSGTPQLALDIGGETRQADYASGSGTESLLFSYTVAEDDEDTEGIGVPADSLTLNGGAITAITADGLAATLSLSRFSLGGVLVDGVRPIPEFAATSVDGNSVFIIFSETLSATTAPASAFTLSVDTGTAPTVSTATASGDKVTLALASALTSGQAVTVAYIDPTLGNDAAAVQDAVGNDAVSFTTGEGGVPAVANAVGTGCSLVDGCYLVSADWGLIPTGLGAGAEFRLLFRTSGTRNAASTDIADYNTFVQTAAGGGHADIQQYSSTIRVLGSTAAVDARDNTVTTYTADDKGVAIYWLGGAKVADDYEDFYDGSWSNGDAGKDEHGADRAPEAIFLQAVGTFTGSVPNGTEAATGLGASRGLGASSVRLGEPFSGSTSVSNANLGPFYGLSPVFRVEGQVVTNTAPAFTVGPDFNHDENQAISFVAVAMDADAGDEVTYAVTGGADQVLFTIGATSGVGTFATAPDHENPTDADGNNVYLVTVTATGGTGARALTTDQAFTVTVNDVDEPPSAPAVPTVSAVSGMTDLLSVTWTAPENTGKPAIESYDLQYRKGITGNFADGPQDVTGLTANIEGLDAGSAYQVQVRATNDEGDSAWSTAGSGSTNAQAEELAETTVPADWSLIPSGLGAGDRFRLIFISSTTRNATATAIGDYNTFVQTAAASGHADIQQYSSTFRVVGSTADVDARDNTATTYTSADKGVPIYWLGGNKVADQYEDFYDGDWDDEANAKDESGSDRSTTLDTDKPLTGSDHNGTEAFSGSSSRALGASSVQLGSPNSSTSGYGPLGSNFATGNSSARPFYGLSPVFLVSSQVVTNNPPAFTTGADFSTDENQAATFQVTAEDADDGDEVSYAITSLGVDTVYFEINATTGLLALLLTLDHENPFDANSNNDYRVTVTATGGTGARALSTDQAITVTVNDVDEPPAAPAAPTVSAVSGSSDSLSVTWTAPDNTGRPAIVSYDLQYRKGSAGTFADGPQDVTGLTDTISGLDEDSAYQVQVRATNEDGDSAWSSAGSGTTNEPADPTDADNLTATAHTGKISLEWTASGDAYEFRRKEDGGAWSAWTAAETRGWFVLRDATTLDDYDVLALTAYTYQVRVAGDAGNLGEASATLGPPITLRLGATEYRVDEGAGELFFTVLAETPAGLGRYDRDIRPSFTSAGVPGPLPEGPPVKTQEDYELLIESLRIEPDDFVLVKGMYVASRLRSVGIVDDTLVEGDETFELRLLLAGGVSRFFTLGAGDGRAKVTIVDNDTGEAPTSEPATFAPLTGFELVDATAHLDAGAVDDGATLTGIDPAKVYGFRANVASGAELKSVRLELSGPGPDDRVARTDNDEPYALHGDSDGHEHGAALPAGSYTLTATAHSEKDGGGSELGTLSVKFTVAGEPLTARFEGMPEGTHGGAGMPFAFRLSFSEAVTTTPEALRDHALEVTNAAVEAVSRVDERSDLWEVRLTPESGAMVTVSLLPAADCDAAGAVCTEDGRMLSVGVARVILGPPPNSPATGQPTISGTAQVGSTLTADTSGIVDEDGLDNVTFSYQWMADDANIQGATGSTYTLADRDKGKTIKVRVSFTDDANHEESLPSAATDAVAVLPGKPQDLEGKATAQEIELTWKAPTGPAVVEYVVYRGILQNGSMNGQALSKYATIDAAGKAMTYTDDNVEEGVEYRYRVAAVNADGEGKKSIWLDITAK